MYLFTSATERALARTSSAFRQLDVRKQRHVTTYVSKLVAMTVSFGLTLGYGGTLIFTGQIGSVTNLVNLKLGLLVMTASYLFELLYRIRIGRLLVIHHLIFVSLVVCAVLYAYDTTPSREATSLLRITLLLSLLGNTEQLTMLGVILYRLGSVWSPQVLKVKIYPLLIHFLILSLLFLWLLLFHPKRDPARLFKRFLCFPTIHSLLLVGGRDRKRDSQYVFTRLLISQSLDEVRRIADAFKFRRLDVGKGRTPPHCARFERVALQLCDTCHVIQGHSVNESHGF